MNHKRGKPKSSRAGCLLCKNHKLQRRKNGRTLRNGTKKPSSKNHAEGKEAGEGQD